MYLPLTKETLDSWFTKKGERLVPRPNLDTTTVRPQDAEAARKHLNSVPEDVCEHCGGSGEVSVQEAVWPGEPHMADVGSRPCPHCKSHDVDRDEE